MPSVPTLPRAVLFDWDNTLVDNWETIRAALNAALEWDGQEPWTEEEARDRIRQSLRDSFPRIFGDRWEGARDVFYGHFEAHHLDYLRPTEGAQEMLEAFAGTGAYMAVVSNKTGRFLRAESSVLGWDRFFGRLVGSTDAPADKPACEAVHMALEPSGMPAGPDVWLVGDADIDMQCALASGCVPVLVGEGAGDFTRFPPAHRFETCAMIARLVRDAGVSS
ncbi:HAD family hydrolase [Arenibaculum pallidiluteum]|uniref:HAD family hydrolase n=1 Tax=Arenibaculum pallidiluteum TaxID=2812559 RepID=UPI001A961415|nr:HAD hydrolase-like protein [Arenibaculum pallidiluteum]